MPTRNSWIVRWLDSLIVRIKILVKKLPNYPTTQLPNSRSAFTLIELLVVITIIAILVAAATASWRNAQEKSRDGKRKSDLKAIQQALELYFQTNAKYPDHGNSPSTDAFKCNVSGDQTIKAWGGDFTCGQGSERITYMNPIPKDPIGTGDFVYSYQIIGSSPIPLKYVLSAKVENPKDPDICKPNSGNDCESKLGCRPASNKNFCVINP